MGKSINQASGINLAELRDDLTESFEVYDIRTDRKELLSQLAGAFSGSKKRDVLTASKIYGRLPDQLRPFEEAFYEHSVDGQSALMPGEWCESLARAMPYRVDGRQANQELAAQRVKRATKWRSFRNPDLQEALSTAEQSLRSGESIPRSVLGSIRDLRNGALWGDEKALDELLSGLENILNPQSSAKFATCSRMLHGNPEEFGVEMKRDQKAFLKILRTSRDSENRRSLRYAPGRNASGLPETG